MSVVRALRWALVLLLVTVFACWPEIVGPRQSALPADPMPPITVLPLPSPTVFVFLTPTPTVQDAVLVTRVPASPTPTFTPLPTVTPTVEPARSPIQRG